jgi:hypothetical protein
MPGNIFIRKDAFVDTEIQFLTDTIIKAAGETSDCPLAVVNIDQTGSVPHHASLYIGVTE